MCGEMNIRLSDFYEYTPLEFFALREGFVNIRDADSQERLLLTRKLMWASLAPYSKRLKEQDIMKFEFELQAQEKAAKLDSEETKKELEQAMNFWKQYDFQKKNKNRC
jgi:hypothetical protein